MRTVLLLLITASLIAGGSFLLGNQYGASNMNKAWDARVTESTELLVEGTYQMALTNTRACVLAVDSSFMRFLSTPTPEVLSELRSRYGACEQHWELLHKYSPNDPEEYRNIDEARWMFDNWGEQIDWALELQVRLIVAFNDGDDAHAAELYKALIEERAESKKFRDHIERELIEAW